MGSDPLLVVANISDLHEWTTFILLFSPSWATQNHTEHVKAILTFVARAELESRTWIDHQWNNFYGAV